MSRRIVYRVAGLAWADGVMEGAFFIMQKYLTDVWKLSFTNAASLLNIWGGIYRILPIFFLFLADTFFGNFITLTFSAISSTAGVVLITVATAPVFGKTISSVGTCHEMVDGATCHYNKIWLVGCLNWDALCVGHTEKVLFITGMVLIALGKAARLASTESFLEDQTNKEDSKIEPSCSFIVFICFFCLTPLIVIFAFPYIKRWYILFGVSAICWVISTLFYLSGVFNYKIHGPNPKGSPITDIFRVFVAAAFKRSHTFPQDKSQLHCIQGEEFNELSSSRILGFLHKASIKLPDETSGSDTRSWKLCSVSQVESVKTVIRMVPMWVPFIMFGVVSSAGNTYFVEQATHMNTDIGSWHAPLQMLLVIFTISRYTSAIPACCMIALGKYGAILCGVWSAEFSILCTTVAAAVERRRLHAVRRHRLLDLPDNTKVPMSAAWLYFQVCFLSALDAFSQSGLSAFHLSETPVSMKRYEDCFCEAVAGLGFITSALSVYVVGKVSEIGSSKNWFQYTLNRSRLDRYYWVLATLCALNLFVFIGTVCRYSFKKRKEANEDDDEFDANAKEAGSEMAGIKKSSALGLLVNRINWD